MIRFGTILSVFLLAAGLSISVSGQKSVRTSKLAAKKAIAACQVNEVSFSCPKGFSAFSRDETNGWLLFRSNADKNFGLFVLAPSAVSFERDFLVKTAETIAAKLFPKQRANYEWKDGNLVRFGDGETPMSKSQAHSKTIRGYNKNHLLLANFRYIEFNNKKFIVGYIIESAAGKDAKELFEMEETASTAYEACSSQLGLIYSITGEKLKKGDDPCEVTVEMEAEQ